MNVKKIGLTGLVGFVAMAFVGGLSSGLYHAKHMTELSQKFPGIVQWPFDMVPPLVGMLVYIFVMAIIYDIMGVVGYEQGAITGAWFGAAKWFFFNSQMMGIFKRNESRGRTEWDTINRIRNKWKGKVIVKGGM